jgi:LPS sulfotransferase NodH
MTSLSSYVICATPRSGTTLLCDLLAQTGVAGKPNSYYRAQNILEWADDWDVPKPHTLGEAAFEGAYLDAVRRVGAAGTGLFGLRLMWGTVPELRERLRTIFPDAADDAALLEEAFGTVRYIHLERLDKVAQAISRLRAEQSGLWHRAADGSERERAAPSAPETYDADLLASLVREAEADNASWEAWFAAQGIAPLRLTYEDLSAAPQAVLAKVLSALGQDPAIAAAIQVQTAKLADATSREWAARFRREAGD